METLNLFDLYAKISLDSTGYEKAVKDATKDSGGLISRFREIAKTSETTGNKIKVLAGRYSAAQAEVNKLADAFNKSAKENGVASKETQKLAQELQDAENKARGLKTQLDQMANSAKNSGGMFDKLKNGISTFGKVAAVGIGAVTTAAGAAVGGLLALEQSTEEYRIAMGRLNTAFESAGYGAEAANQAYSDFYGILGDTDRATEASQLLAKLADNEEDLAEWTNIAAGVNGTFGDSLPIESLIEAANETARTGQVVGTLADALNWAGTVGEDEFNAMLASCSSESERNQLIMETLAGTYDEAANAFYRNNEALVASREAQVQMDEVLSNLGQTVASVKNQLTAEFIPVIAQVATAFNGMLSGAEGADEAFATAVQGLVQKAVEQLPAFLNMGVQILSSLASGIVQSIPTLVSAVPQIVTEFGTALANLLPQVLDMGVQLLDQFTSGIETGLPDMVSRLPQIIDEFLNFITERLPDILDQGVEMLVSLTNGIMDAIPEFVSNLPRIITSFVSFITENLPKIVESGGEILGNLITGIIENIPQLVSALPQIISAIVTGITNLLGNIVDVGKAIVDGIWKGISDTAKWLTDKVTGWFDGVVADVKSFLGIASPSKVFAGIGKNMALGVGEGWEKEFGDVRGQIEDGLKFDSAAIDMDASAMGRAFGAVEAGAFGGGAYAGTTININIDGARYSDENALAEAIAQRIETMTNRRGAVFA